MGKQDLLSFAVRRIQERENLPEISDELEERIRLLAREIASKENVDEIIMRGFLQMLEGIPAEHSLRAAAMLLDSIHEEGVRRLSLNTRALNLRIDYFDRIRMLSELFSVARVQRIVETTNYIKMGWGWVR